jgi:hypothetical protein
MGPTILVFAGSWLVRMDNQMLIVEGGDEN